MMRDLGFVGVGWVGLLLLGWAFIHGAAKARRRAVQRELAARKYRRAA